MSALSDSHEGSPATPIGRRTWVVAIAAIALACLATMDAWPGAVLWELAHWTLFALVAVWTAIVGVRSSVGVERRVRIGIAAAATCWFIGQLAWDAQVAMGLTVVPAPSDVFFIATIVPAVWALDQAVRPHAKGRVLFGLYLDAGAVLLSSATVMALVFDGHVATGDLPTTVVLLSFPVVFLSVAGAGLVVALATGASIRPVGAYALLLGTALLGVAYLPWVADAPAVPAPGTWTNLLFSAGAVLVGVSGATYRLPPPRSSQAIDGRSRVLDALPAASVAIALVCLISAANMATPPDLVRPLGWAVIVTAVIRQVLLARERAEAVRLANNAAAEVSHAEKRHRSVIERIPATLYIDERATPQQYPSNLAFVSPQVSRLLGYTGDQLRAFPDWWYELVHPDDAAAVGEAEERHFSEGVPLDQTFRMKAADGRYVWVRDEANLIMLPDGRRQSHGVLTDVTAQRQAEEQLRSSEEQQRRIIETASAAYISIDAQGRVIDWNELAAALFGWQRAEAIGQRLSELIIPPEARVAHERGLVRYVETAAGPLVGKRVEVQAVGRDGRNFPIELTIWPVRVGTDLTFSALVHDITERRRLEEELRHQAFHDSLTGLANRALFVDRLVHALERRGPLETAVLYFDVDDFKLVNDELGHAAGDELLVQVGRRLETILRSGDTAARLGGDEFAVLVETTDEPSARAVAERIIDVFAEAFTIGDRRVAAQASVGVAIGGIGTEPEALMRNADVAMYEAKRRGKGVWQLFDPNLSRSGLEALELRADLKQAVNTHQIALAYQPIVDLETRQIVAVEALARWTHPTRGVVPPAEFIPIAEGSELISTLGLQVLSDACTTVQAWRRAPWGKSDLRVSVNLSARQLLSPTVVGDVAAVLSRSALPADALTLEITEGVVVDEAGASIAAIEGLKALGVQIAIDDFGTGYSSLSYLSRLPIDVLKVDRSFVAAMDASRQAAALVKSIVRIGQTLHLETVAEGVETEAQVERLLRVGARYGQGYLFASPLTSEGFSKVLKRRRATEAHRSAV